MTSHQRLDNSDVSANKDDDATDLVKVLRTSLWLSIVVLPLWLLVLFYFFPNAGTLLAANWVIVPLAFIGAAFANATAVGGGFIFVPLFIFGYGLVPVVALKLSLATQAFGMSAGAFGWSRKFFIPGALILAVLASIPGMYIGTFEWELSNRLIKETFGWVSLFIFSALLLEIRFGTRTHRERIENDNLLLSFLYIAACFFGGVITAWTAIGIGEVVALFLLFVYRIRIEAAIGTGVAVLAVDSIVGFGFHIGLGGIPWEYLAFTIPGVIIGGFFGARIGKAVEARLHVAAGPDVAPPVATHSPLKRLLALVIGLDGLVILFQSYLV